MTKPKFISRSFDDTPQSSFSALRKFAKTASVVLLVGLIGSLAVNQGVNAEERDEYSLGVDDIINNINSVEEGEYVSRDLKMLLVDKRGKVRERNTRAFRKYYGEEKKTILFYKKPTNVKGTAFLTFDYPDPSIDDDQWLYLPALRKVRRISASDRGDYFLGTDFTYEDIKQEGKIEITDYQHTRLRVEEISLKNSDGSEEKIKAIVLEGIPRNDEIAKELGYGRTELWVDPRSWLIRKSIFWDPKNNLLKTLVITDVNKVDGVLTRHKMVVDNHKTGHHSEFIFSNVDYKSPVKDSLFTQSAMKRGR